ncbi:hypothetical protein Acr_00g0082410 [Actinidia rufa]|uniref:Transposase (putative) gypsy type domain-containing protein n=1 Tax=Actinidia rufa TaxID=165716 RepID=A0A7J0DVW7_9ERIC|nr:hypothetical protein Acr_00g0082410 [Actinidia rufa]
MKFYRFEALQLLSRKGLRPQPVNGLWTMGPRESRSPNRQSQRRLKTDTRASEAPARPPIASGEEKILAGVILPADKEKVDRLTFDQVVTKFIHAIGQGVILGSSLAFRSRDFAESALNQKAVAESAKMEMVRAQNRAIELEGALAEEKAKGKKLSKDADAREKVIARLEARISELERSQSVTQGRIIAAFKESDDFLEAYPDLGVDLEGVDMDHELLAKEEAEAEKKAAEEGAAGAEGLINGDVCNGDQDSSSRFVTIWRSRPLTPLAIQRFGRHGSTFGRASSFSATRVERQSQRTRSRSHVDRKLNAEWVVSAGKWFNGGNGGFYFSEIGTSRDLGHWARSITVLSCMYINGVNLFICTFPLLSKCCSVSELHLAVNRSTVPFMFSKTNLEGEESEQSLPSWISDHLRAKSYIDETSQSPLFPPIPPNSPEMDTSSLTKEGNVMSQSELDKLGSTYSFPPSLRLRIPGDGETILSARQGEVAFYEAAFLAGLRLPIHPTIREILIHYKICPAQLSPNSWQSVICSLVIWRHFKCHLSCDEFRCLYSLSALPDSGWYYFKARPEKNLFRGSPSNVKGWKTRLFFASGDEWEFPSGVAASDTTPRVPKSWGTPGKSYNKLPTLSEVDAERTEAIFGKIEPGGYFEVSKVLGSRTFRKHFVVGCTALSTSGRDNTTSGDEGEFVTCEDSVEYLGIPVIEIGEPDSSKGKEAAPPPPPKRFKSNRGAINTKGRAAEAGTSSPGGEVGSESMSDASVARRLLTGVIPASDKKEVDQLSENELVAKSFHALGQVVVFASSLALRSQEHLHDIDFHMARADSAELELVKAQKRAVKAENRLAELSEERSKPGTEVDDLKATVAELTNKLEKAKELAIEDFKASGEFKAAVTDSAATYFSDGFEFCKRQLLHQFPNLGIDVANMAMDPSFAEEEEAMKGGEDPVAGVAPNV